MVLTGALDSTYEMLFRGRSQYGWEKRLGALLQSAPVASWAVVTGANTGIGYEVARILAEAGLNVVLACRSRERGLEAEARLRGSLGATASEVEYLPVDVGSFGSVAKLAEAVRGRRVSLLVCNAGFWPGEWEMNEDGYNPAFAANQLGHALLSQLLLPQLRGQGEGRIVFVTSSTAGWKSTVWRPELFHPNMPEPMHYNKYLFYGDIKAAQLCYALALAERLRKDPRSSNIAVKAVHPGNAVTNITLTWPGGRLLKYGSALVNISPREAASYVARACLAEDCRPGADTGAYFHCGWASDPGPIAGDASVCEKAWSLTQDVLSRHGWTQAVGAC